MFSPDITNAALLRMRKAHEAGRGVRLSADELDAFSVETLGDWWGSITDDGRNIQEDMDVENERKKPKEPSE